MNNRNQGHRNQGPPRRPQPPPQPPRATHSRAELDELIPYADVFYQSRFFRLENQAQGIVQLMAGKAMGLNPFESMQALHIIEGRPSLAANAYASFLRKHPGYDYRELTDPNDRDVECTIQFLRRQPGATQWEELGVHTVTLEQARKLKWHISKKGTAKENWHVHPGAMLFARCISQGCRRFCPDVFSCAVYTTDEMDDGGAPEREAEFVRSETIPPASPAGKAPKPEPEPEPEPEVVFDAEWEAAVAPPAEGQPEEPKAKEPKAKPKAEPKAKKGGKQ